MTHSPIWFQQLDAVWLCTVNDSVNVLVCGAAAADTVLCLSIAAVVAHTRISERGACVCACLFLARTLIKNAYLRRVEGCFDFISRTIQRLMVLWCLHFILLHFTLKFKAHQTHTRALSLPLIYPSHAININFWAHLVRSIALIHDVPALLLFMLLPLLLLLSSFFSLLFLLVHHLAKNCHKHGHSRGIYT